MDWGLLPGLSKEAAGLGALVFVGWIVYLIAKPVIARTQANGEKSDKRNSDQVDKLLTMLQQTHESNNSQSREIAGQMAMTNATLASHTATVGTLVAAVNKLASDIGINSTREEERSKIRTKQWDSIAVALEKLGEGRQLDAKREAVSRARKKQSLDEVLV